MPASGVDIVIMKKNGDWHSSTMPEEGEEALYKRCGFKKPDGFAVHCTWGIPDGTSTVFVKIYGKTDGRTGSENKTELPPPVDTTLFFGNIAAAASIGLDVESAKPAPLSAKRLATLFDLLIGGTETLGGAGADADDAAEDAENGAEDEEVVEALPRTRHGYVKDGFVVDDTSESEDDEGGDEEGEGDSDGSEGLATGDETDGDDTAGEDDGSEVDGDEDAADSSVTPAPKGERGTELSAEDYDSE